MVTYVELLAAVPSGAVGFPKPGDGYMRLSNQVVVDAASGGIVEVDGQKPVSVWTAYGVELDVAVREELFSVTDPEARWSIGVTATQLLLSVAKGSTPVGYLEWFKERKLLAFAWSFDSIEQLYAGRVRMWGRWWVEEVIVRSPSGTSILRLHKVQSGGDGLFKTLGKGAFNGVEQRFVDDLAAAIAMDRTNLAPEWQIDGAGGKEESWTLEVPTT